MKEIFVIALRLTVSCLIAGVIMGGVYAMTEGPKKRNEQLNEQRVMLGLLGFGSQDSAPSDVEFNTVYRYVLDKRPENYLAYLLPTSAQQQLLLIIDLSGRYVAQHPLTLSSSQAEDQILRDQLIANAIGGEYGFQYADHVVVVNQGGQRLAYLLPGKFAGFKTHIRIMLALDAELGVKGFEVLEHEEDPGLGGEIVKDYFKQQFSGKTLGAMKNIKVVKMPLPEEYRRYLEDDTDLSVAQRDEIRSQHQHDAIYALTGATISSEAVTNGLRKLLKKFAYRIDVLNRVIDEQALGVAF